MRVPLPAGMNVVVATVVVMGTGSAARGAGQVDAEPDAGRTEACGTIGRTRSGTASVKTE